MWIALLLPGSPLGAAADCSQWRRPAPSGLVWAGPRGSGHPRNGERVRGALDRLAPAELWLPAAGHWQGRRARTLQVGLAWARVSAVCELVWIGDHRFLLRTEPDASVLALLAEWLRGQSSGKAQLRTTVVLAGDLGASLPASSLDSD